MARWVDYGARMDRLDLSDMPDDPLDALAYLQEVEAELAEVIGELYSRVYFDLRMHRLLDVAFELGRHSRTQVLRMIRARNLPGRAGVSWGDGLDRTSTGYSRTD